MLFFEEMATGSFVLYFSGDMVRDFVSLPRPVKSNPLFARGYLPAQFAIGQRGGEKLHFNLTQGFLKFINMVLLDKNSVPPVTALAPR